MGCLFGTYGPNPKFKPNKKNGGNPPEAIDERIKTVAWACNKCSECRKREARDQKIRLFEEFKDWDKDEILFVTFTISDENMIILKEIIDSRSKIKLDGYDLEIKIATEAIQQFSEQWRTELKTKIRVRHWFVTELGQKNTERIHLHGFLFTKEYKTKTIQEKTGLKFKSGYEIKDDHKRRKYLSTEIQKIWKFGRVDADYPHGKGIAAQYTIKYIAKPDHIHAMFKPKVLKTNQPTGIGYGFIRRWKDEIEKTGINPYEYRKNGMTNTKYRLELAGAKGWREVDMPLYYKNFIWGDKVDKRTGKIIEEGVKDKILLDNIEEGYRYVAGKKYNTNTEQGLKAWESALIMEQQKSDRRKFGKATNEWDVKQYNKDRIKHIENLKEAERQKRNNMMEERQKAIEEIKKKRKEKE